MPIELLIPIARRQPFYLANQREVPWTLRGYVSGAFGQGAINLNEIGHIFGGRAARPTKPLYVLGPDPRVITLVVGGGETEAAELEDLALAATEKNEREMKDRSAVMRERVGARPKETVDAAVREHFAKIARDQIKNAITNPPPRRTEAQIDRRKAMIAALPEIKE